MKKYPNVLNVRDIIQHANNCHTLINHNHKWVPARPLPFYGGFFRRLKIAYNVFIGKYDALEWEDQ